MTETIKTRKPKPFTGAPSLQGDVWIAWHRLSLAVLCEGDSVIKNVPDTIFVNSLLSLYEQLGISVQREETTLNVQGKWGKPTPLDSPINPRHEIPFMTLGAWFSGFESSNQISVHPHSIPKETSELFEKLFDCQTRNGTEDKFKFFSLSDLRTKIALKEKSNSLVKIARVYSQIVASQTGEVDVTDSGPDHLEKAACFFGEGISFRATGTEELDELTKRIQKKLGQLEKPSQTLILPEKIAFKGKTSEIPNDVTETALHILAATLIRGSSITLENASINPSRIAFINALKRMGASIVFSKRRDKQGEPTGTLTVEFAELVGRKFDFKTMQGMREEIPLLIIAGALAEGKTIIRNVSFLRTYELDLLRTMIQDLKAAGVEIGEIEDGLVIKGRESYSGSHFTSHNQWILGWAYLIFSLRCHGDSQIENTECMRSIYPKAWEHFQKSQLTQN